MILTCPSCSARYLIAADALGAEGRTVRCGKCGNSWEQEPVLDSLDELREPGNSEQAEREMRESIQAIMEDDDVIGAPPPKEPDPDPVPDFIIRPKPETVKKTAEPGKYRTLSGVAAGVVLFALITALVLANKTAITHAIPATAPLFSSGGQDAAEVEKVLVFDSITAKIEGKTLDVTGSLINLSAEVMELPPLQVDLLDSSGAKIKSLPAGLKQTSIKGEETIGLHFSFTDIPDEAQQARLRFDSGHETEEGAHEEKAEESGHSTTDAKDAGNTPAH